jgi:hypothetical protein
MKRLGLVCLFVVSLMGVSVFGQTKPILQPVDTPPIKFDHEITIEDDSTGSYLMFDPNTGEYRFNRCSDGAFLSGFGKVKVNGCAITLEVSARDRRVLATVDECTQVAKAAVEIFAPVLGPANTKPLKEFLSDKDMRNNTLSCVPQQKTQD